MAAEDTVAAGDMAPSNRRSCRSEHMTGVVGLVIDLLHYRCGNQYPRRPYGRRAVCSSGFNTRPLFQQVTKYAVMLDNVATVSEVEKCIHMATSPRLVLPG